MRNWSYPLLNKSHLRAVLRKKRSEVDPELRLVAAHKASNLLLASTLFQKCQHIACYWSFQDEFDTRPLMEMIWLAKKHCYLPVLREDKSLAFYHYEKNDALVTNQYGIPEPVTADKSAFPVDRLEIVLVPMIGFDLKGNRLGTGGGYYDRTFAFLLEQSKPHSPCLIGLSYQCQAVDVLPTDTWDVPLDGILTEKKLLI